MLGRAPRGVKHGRSASKPLFPILCEPRAMHATPARTGALAALLVSALVSTQASPREAAETQPTQDPLAAEIARLQAELASSTAKGEIWDDVRSGSGPMLLRAETALRDGRRWLALDRLAAAREGLAAARYLYSLPEAQRQDPARFEAEWRRVGELLRSDLAATRASALDGVAPGRRSRHRRGGAAAGARATTRRASTTGRTPCPTPASTTSARRSPSASSRRSCARLAAPGVPDRPRACARSSPSSTRSRPRSSRPTVRPPRSTATPSSSARAPRSRKPASSTRAGLRYGALLRYLQSLQRFAPLRSAPAAAPRRGRVGGLRGAPARVDERLAARRRRSHASAGSSWRRPRRLAGARQGRRPGRGAAIADDVLPALLRRARARAAPAAPARGRASP